MKCKTYKLKPLSDLDFPAKHCKSCKFSKGCPNKKVESFMPCYRYMPKGKGRQERMNNIKKALEYIKGYCNKHYDCDSCKLADKNECCFLREQNEPPADWDINKILEKEKEK